jgi:hypothetical protein
MRRLVPFELANGTTIMVEVDEPDSTGAIRAGGPQEKVDGRPRSFEDAMQQIHSATDSAIKHLLSLSRRPDSFDMEFGFNLSAQFGAVIARGTAEATYKVTLHWEQGKEETEHK